MGGPKKKNDKVTNTAARVLRNRKVAVESPESQKEDDDVENKFGDSDLDRNSVQRESKEAEVSKFSDAINKKVDDDHVSVHDEDSDDDDGHTKQSNDKEETSHETQTETPVTNIPSISYVKVVAGLTKEKAVNFMFIEQEQPQDDSIDVLITVESVQEATKRYTNTLYGYFLGRRVAFPVVQNYAMNTWKKYGVEKVMMNAKGFFFFKFSSKEGMINVMQNGPRMIRTMPIILNVWSSNVSLTKEDLTKVPVWVKLHDVPLTGFTEMGLSIIASKIGRPMMLDSYTSNMCLESWGRPNFARAMIEVSADKELRNTIKVGTPNDNGTNTMDVVTIEYEWKPPRCSCCKVFGHRDSQCPKQIIKEAVKTKQVDDDGFTQVVNKKHTDKTGDKPKQVSFQVGKGKQTLVYRPKQKVDVEKPKLRTCPSSSTVKTSNTFGVLNAENYSGGDNDKSLGINLNLMDEDSDVEVNDDETSRFVASKISEGASTPGNIRGLIQIPKQKEVRDVVVSNKLCVCIVLESHVSISRLNDICNLVFPNWCWSSNNNVCLNGTRIIVGWDPGVVQLVFIDMTDQVVHCVVKTLNGNWESFVSFVYADNYYIQRRHLWNSLLLHKRYVGNKPWVLLGDFNVALDIEESTASSSSCTLAMLEFRECIDNLNMADVNHGGFQYTWNQRPNSDTGILKKIDRVLANDVFISNFMNAHVIFQPYRISNHCPAVLKIPVGLKSNPKPFKFSNYIVNHENFKMVVEEEWQANVQGHLMYRVVKKLRNLKKPIRKLMWSKGNLHDRVLRCRGVLDDARKALDNDPFSSHARSHASQALKDYNLAIIEEESFLKQKSKIEWLGVGDHNSSYFHKVVKGRANRNRIVSIQDDQGNMLEGDDVTKLFVQHYTNFLGSTSVCDDLHDPSSLFTKKISHQNAMHMIRPISDDEVKKAIFGIGDNKSPGPDGYSALLKEINNTTITLLPKVHVPNKVTDFRPISCCNVIYKCISKIISNRIKSSLDDVVSKNQSAFISGLRIADNVLLTQEIMKNYHLDRGIPRCAFKVDIQKAYDTVDWKFLESALTWFSFPRLMIKWIMTCVSTTTYSICINGDLHGFFKGKRGLWQGDPMSPYLFTLVMEVLTLMLKRNVERSTMFKYHPKCKKHHIEKLIRGFLWCQGELKRGKAKVRWDDVCLPKEEGGLGIKRLKSWNTALMASLLWRLLTAKNLIWVDWVRYYKLADRSLWEIGIDANASWSWHKLLQIRPLVRYSFMYQVGNGHTPLVWFDIWSNVGPLVDIIPIEVIVNDGFYKYDKVCDVIGPNGAVWPIDWPLRFPALQSITLPVFSSQDGKLVFKGHNDSLKSGSVAAIWDAIRPRAPLVNWFKVVWFNQCIPKHAFIMWLLMGERLKTQDKLKPWDFCANPVLLCVFCNQCMDSHEHLFFKCSYPSLVWHRMCALIQLDMVDDWKLCRDVLIPVANRNSSTVVVAKLCYAAAVYFIWQERNNRLFKRKSKSVEQLFEMIRSNVRLKLMSILFKDSARVHQLKVDWQLG
ncbi:uncharacterized protein [Rutidosis leptorrhynchoides]|uniref:uncharacterized protein n=1 Tax=Rutidosis leptorrhynchoides TaxID=125765 RepID=UPI003A991BC5